MRKIKIVFASSFVLLFALSGSLAANAWFVQRQVRTIVVSPAGEEAVCVSTRLPVENERTSTNLAVTVQIDNDSVVDTYMRLNWLPYFADDNGSPLAKDVAGVSLVKAYGAMEDGTSFEGTQGETLPGGPQNTVFFTERNGAYTFVPAGKSLSVTLEVQAEDTTDLSLRLRVEAIQATADAAASALAWGWDPAKATVQIDRLHKEVVRP